MATHTPPASPPVSSLPAARYGKREKRGERGRDCSAILHITAKLSPHVVTSVTFGSLGCADGQHRHTAPRALKMHRRETKGRRGGWTRWRNEMVSPGGGPRAPPVPAVCWESTGLWQMAFTERRSYREKERKKQKFRIEMEHKGERQKKRRDGILKCEGREHAGELSSKPTAPQGQQRPEHTQRSGRPQAETDRHQHKCMETV